MKPVWLHSTAMKMNRSIAILLVFPTLLLACGEVAEPIDIQMEQTRTLALGEPLGDFPSYSERVLLYLTNQLRVAPTTFNPGEPYDPSPPLRYDVALGRAARFHAQHILDASCWCEDHSSCCDLEMGPDGPQCAGASTGCGVTDAATRVTMFSPAYTGENMAMGQMTPAQAINGWTFSSGHWANINTASHRLLGTGNFETAWVQDFGGGGSPPVIGDGIHINEGGTTRFGITYYQTDTGGPRTALVIVEGVCHDLQLVHGTPELGSFEVSTSLGQGCHRYYFHFTDGQGNDFTYPSRGSFGVGNSAECEFFIEERPADSCSPSGQTCETGDTRACYTGPFGTRNVGACEEGIERCIAGKWTGECLNQVTPVDDFCDGEDLDCDGTVDEGCVSEEPEPEVPTEDPEDATGSEKDMEAEGCSTTGGIGHLWFVGFIVIVARVRRRRPL